jgi:hypothetical protein
MQNVSKEKGGALHADRMRVLTPAVHHHRSAPKMPRQERTTRLVKRISVVDSSGAHGTIEGWGDFVRVQYTDGAWSDWQLGIVRLRLNGRPVNPTDDPDVFELAETMEKLTAVQPRQ